jgi:hypothetical protein
MMKKAVFTFCLLALLFSAASLCAQEKGMSTALTECTVIYQVYALLAQTQGKPEKMTADFNAAAARFRDAALKAAAQEGAMDPKHHVSATYNNLLPKWQEKYAAITGEDMDAMLQGTRHLIDAVETCGETGRKLGILPLTAPVE